MDVLKASTKKPPNKKRHTKPCRFFQTGTCPYTAEECDFAHIIAIQPGMQNSKPCKYFLAGNCNNGIWCRYRHEHEQMSPTMVSLTPIEDPRHASQSNEDINGIYVSPLSPCQTVYVASPLWPLCSPTQFASDYDPRRYNPHHTSILPSFDSPSTSDSGDDYTFFSEDTLQTRTTAEYSPITHSLSPLLSPTIAHAPAFTFPVYSPSSSPVKPTAPREGQSSPTNRAARQKALSYKTKPCRFYQPELSRLCPNGDNCTFIHDHPAPVRRSTELFIDHDSHGLPPKPVSLEEEKKKHGFYPITWRVVSGGVMMGKKDTDCDCRSAGCSDGYDPDFSAGDIQLQVKERRPLSIGITFPRNDSDTEDEDEEFSCARITPRARASSIPSTPRVTQVNTHHLFSAESP